MTEQADRWMEQIRSDSLGQLEAIQEMQTAIGQVRGEAQSARGLVRVRVTPAGMPTQLVLAPEVTDLEADEIAQHVMGAIAEATAQASAQLRAIVGGIIPDEQLDAMMSGDVSASDRADVQEQIDRLRADVS